MTAAGRVVTFGLTPAWQRVMRFGRFDPDRVNRARETAACAAGKAVNAARAAATALRASSRGADAGVVAGEQRPVATGGRAVAAVAPLGGLTGALAAAQLVADDVEVVREDPGHELRVCVTVIDDATGAVTELVEETPAMTGAVAQRLVERCRALGEGADAVGGTGGALGGAVLVCSGTLPPGVGAEVYGRVIGGGGGGGRVGRRGSWSWVVVDAKGEPLTAALAAAASASVAAVAKVNREELEQTTACGAALEEGIRRLHTLGARCVVVTAGGGDVVVSDGDVLRRYRVPEVRRLNTTGCGDCMAGVLAAMLASGRDFLDAVVWAVAAASASAETLLPAVYDIERAAQLEREVRQWAA
ncbi:MAG: PfkB family carbohydrate kinase [Tepidisphaerales bacterium]